MSFTDVFIRRPVFASAISLAILVIGALSFSKMTVREYPQVDASVVTINTLYPGASAELMTGFVTTPLETAIGSVDGIDYMQSTNTQNTSQISVNLKLGYPMEIAITDVGNAVNSVLWQLPEGIQNPVVTKQDPNQNPIVYVSFNSDTMTQEAVTDYILRVVQPQLQTLNGVSEADIIGIREYAMRVNLDSRLMTSLNLTASDVMSILNTHNMQAAAGRIEGQSQEFNIVANTDLSTAREFNNIVLSSKDGSLVRLSNIGEAVLGANSYRNSAVMNGSYTTTVGVIPTSDANPLAVSQEVQKILPSIQADLPSELKAVLVYDSSNYIRASIEEVWETMAIAGILVIIVIFGFLGSFRAVFIPLVTIPLSLIGVCTLMYGLGFTINTLTLLAWVIAIGLVVDDAIVVLENIHRHMEDGVEPVPAAIIGAREIGFAVVAMTITLAAVYTPIGFTGGLTGILFTEFAFTLAGAVIVSGFIALTLTPMMCSRMLTHNTLDEGLAKKINDFFAKVVSSYKKTLTKVINYRWLVMLFAGLTYVLLYFLFVTTPQELAPIEDQGVIMSYINGPSASNIKYTEKYTSMLNPIYATVPELDSYGILNGFPTGVNSAISFASLIPWGDRSRTAMVISNSLMPAMWKIPGLKVIPFLPPPLPDSGGALPVQFVLKSTLGIPKLYPAMQALMEAVHNNPGFTGTDTDLKLDKPQVKIDIDRNRAGDLGISMQEIANVLSVMFGEPTNILFEIQGRSYYVIPELTDNFDYKANPDIINDVYVRSQSGELVPLSTIATISENVEAATINHFAQIPSASLLANIRDGYALGTAYQFLTDFVDENFPDMETDTAGQLRQFIEASGAMTQVMIFAVILIFLVLSAQFESYRDSFIVLFVVPLTLCGAILTLRIAGFYGLASGTMSIYTEIGLTTLVGLIAKHGILIVEFSNQLQEKGYEKLDAVIEGASMRLRPILMTTGAMVLGVMPLALASGAGSEARHQLGWVISGGMLIGTCFSLFIVPCFYSILASDKIHDDTLDNQIAEAIEEDLRKKEAALARAKQLQAGRKPG